ncbi:MAG: hypothetical protein IJX06_01050 [Clostridia bacterium]|nr:hypothetical protein [Clostridia bacterium]
MKKYVLVLTILLSILVIPTLVSCSQFNSQKASYDKYEKISWEEKSQIVCDEIAKLYANSAYELQPLYSADGEQDFVLAEFESAYMIYFVLGNKAFLVEWSKRENSPYMLAGCNDNTRKIYCYYNFLRADGEKPIKYYIEKASDAYGNSYYRVETMEESPLSYVYHLYKASARWGYVTDNGILLLRIDGENVLEDGPLYCTANQIKSINENSRKRLIEIYGYL